MRNHKSKKNSSHNKNLIAADSCAKSPNQSETAETGITVAVTFHPRHGILTIGEAHFDKDGGAGFHPNAFLPTAAVQYFEGSAMLFIRSIPQKEIVPILLECCAGNFRAALRKLAELFLECPESERKIGAPTTKLAEQLYWAFQLSQFGYNQVPRKGGEQ